MSNQFIVSANLCADPATVQLGEKEGVRLRLADNTGQKNVTRFFNALFTGRDAEIAQQLKQGDRVIVTGQLVRSSYKSKKDDKKRNIKKGQELESDDMPYARLMEVTKSPSYFNKTEETEEPEASTDTPEGMEDDPLAGL